MFFFNLYIINHLTFRNKKKLDKQLTTQNQKIVLNKIILKNHLCLLPEFFSIGIILFSLEHLSKKITEQHCLYLLVLC